MKDFRFLWIALAVVIATLFVFVAPTHAAETYLYQGESSFRGSFFLIGGQYSLYVNAKRPIKGYSTPESSSCIFGGNLQRVWPTQDTMSLGAGITISTMVPHKIGPETLTLPAGLYVLYIPPLTSCDWKFVLNSTSQNSAGVELVRMLTMSQAGPKFSETASVRDRVQFYAQYRTENDTKAPVSGVVQIINDGKVVQTLPLQVGTDFDGYATVFFVNLQWEPSDANYLGKNSVKFIVKIGSFEFTSSGEFTLTQ